VILRTQKNGKRVSIPLHPDAVTVLKKIENGNHYYFWSGEGSIKSAVSGWSRTFIRVSKIAECRVTAHRWRHTFISKCLMNGIPVSEVAALAGNSPRILEKHYSQWCQGRADVLNEKVLAMWK
jgi:integrase